MSDTKFEVGQRVVVKSRSDLKTWNEYEEDVTRGLVKAITADGGVMVKMDATWHKPNPAKFDANDLMPETEADVILSKLEAEFEAWAGPIREKLEQAGALLKEAGKLAEKQGRDLSEMYDLTDPLTSAMDDIGWRTSSLTC